jgi:multiple antibiotic resistance protein
VNPIGAALIFSQVTADRPASERHAIARRIAVYALIIMLGALWGGAYILDFFGISVAALRLAGGFVVASSAWMLLNQPEQTEARKATQASAEGGGDVAFYPLTIPFTTGPGTIAVAIALSSNLPFGEPGFISFVVGASAAAVAIAASVWFAYRFADRLTQTLGPEQLRVATRLTAFLLLCVGVQIALNGITDFIGGT